MTKITNNPNDRPRTSSADESGSGLPNDSSVPVESSDKEIEEARRKLRKGADTADSIKLERQLERPKRGTA